MTNTNPKETALGARVARMEAELRGVLEGIAGDIASLKTEIASIEQTSTGTIDIPEAGNELAAVVEMTEQASHVIMTASEAILGCEADTLEDYRAAVEGEVMKIFEACSFQDITGQRITKVVETLTAIESRLGEVTSEDASDAHPPSCPDAHLLNGPALPGKGLDQGDIDLLMTNVS
ncbi:MAG: protein phosphatase CheZ [Pseudomonadota bacterium]